MGYDKRRAEQDLRNAGGRLLRHGRKYDIWEVNGIEVRIPRHEGKDLSQKVQRDVIKALGRKPMSGGGNHVSNV